MGGSLESLFIFKALSYIYQLTWDFSIFGGQNSMYQASLLWIIASGPIFCQSACALSARRRTPSPNEGYSVQPYEREQRAKAFLRVFFSLSRLARSFIQALS